MLRTNLSTRPFYNERGVRSALGALALAGLGLTVFNAYETIRLRAQDRDVRQTIAQNDARARELRGQAEVIRRSIDRDRLAAVQVAAGEANALIDRRTFSWTELLNQFQLTLPADVRISGVSPQTDNAGRRLVQISVQSRRIEDLEVFMDALDKTGVFSGVLSRADSPENDGTLRSELQAYYSPAGAAGSAPAASEPGKDSATKPPANISPAGNDTPGKATPGNNTPGKSTPGGPQ
jgi:hypothetical protein